MMAYQPDVVTEWNVARCGRTGAIVHHYLRDTAAVEQGQVLYLEAVLAELIEVGPALGLLLSFEPPFCNYLMMLPEVTNSAIDDPHGLGFKI